MSRVVEKQTQVWWRDKELVYALLLALVVHLPQLTALSIRGEESRWTRVASEFLDRGEWVVPRQQGEPFLSRPPLHSWLIAAAIQIRGDCDLIAIRLPSLLAVLLTTLLVYASARSYLSPLGAMASALAFATMGQVMELGCRAETESIYTLLVSASLLIWHLGEVRHWPISVCWTAGYGLAALATLTKGPQAIVYFASITAVYLLLRRGWRRLFHPGHLLGLFVYALILAAWIVPFIQELGWSGLHYLTTSDVALRFQDTRWTTLAKHLFAYPVEILACTLPWSLLLAALFNRSVRSSLSSAQPAILFLAVCLAVAFPTCWFAPGAQSRYLMPVYPCLAIVLGWIVERISIQPASAAFDRGEMRRRCLALAGTTGLVFTALFTPYIAVRSNDAAAAIAELQECHHPCGLVSFGPIWHQFAYHYRQEIALRRWPNAGDDVSEIDYFCFDRWGQRDVSLPFRWETVAVIPADRYRSDTPGLSIVVGRRLP